MRAVDINILARFVLRDDERQTRKADAMLGELVWMADTVLLELGWVLGRRLGMDRAVVADALETLLGLDTVQTGDRATLRRAVRRYRAGADWADMIQLAVAGRAATVFATFDPGLAAAAGPDSPVPVEALA